MRTRQESGLTFSFWLGPVTLEMSPLRAEHGRGTGLERKMTSYMVDMLSLSCLWDLKGKRCVVLGKLLNRSGTRFLFCFCNVIITYHLLWIFNGIKHI